MAVVTYSFRATTVATSANGDPTPAVFSVVGGAGGETLAQWLADDGATPLRAQSTGSGANDFTENLILGGWVERTTGKTIAQQISGAATVLGVAFKSSGARTSGSGAFRFGSNAVRLKVAGEQYNDLTTQTSALTSFSTSGVAEASVAVQDSVLGELAISRLRDASMQAEYRLNHTSSGSVGVHEPATLEITVDDPYPWGRVIRGAGNVIRRLVGAPGSGHCTLALKVDSLMTGRYGVDAHTGAHYGIRRQWLRNDWSGIFIPADAVGDLSSFVWAPTGGQPWTATTIYPSGSLGELATAAIGNGLTEGIHPVPMTRIDFTADASGGGAAVLRAYLTDVAGRWPLGDWCEGRTLTARFIFLAYADQAPLRARTLRPQPGTTIATNETAFPNPGPGTPAIMYVDVTLGATGSDPEGRVLASDGDEDTRSFYWLGLRIFDPNDPGFEIQPMGIGGASPDDDLEGGGERFAYTTESLEQFYTATNPNTFIRDAGQNLTSAMSTALSAGSLAEFKAATIAGIERDHAAALEADPTAVPMTLLKMTHKTGYSDAIMNLRWQAYAEIAESRDDVDAIDVYTLAGETDGDVVGGGDTVHLTPEGNDRIWGLMWRVMRGYVFGGALMRGSPDAARLGRRVV